MTAVRLSQVVQYIGELCRYLLSQPHCPAEKQHSVRIAIGNGLRPQIWNEFQSRFGINSIGEFYGSTEGNVGFFNIDNTPGACGFVSVIIPKLFPCSFIRVHPVTGELLRDENGLAIPANTGEPGLVVGKIVKGNRTSHACDITKLIITMTKFSNVIGYQQPDLSINWTVYASCL